MKFEEIALYLNLATSKTKDDGGLKWLTGANADSDPKPGDSKALETQTMVVGSGLWIANNEPADSVFQKAFLNHVGVRNLKHLVTHVETYRSRVLPDNQPAKGKQGQVNVVEGSKPGAKLLQKLSGIDNGTDVVAPLKLPKSTADSCSTFALSSPTAVPPASGVVFVTGDYQSTEGSKQHAEQALVAALGRFLTRGTGLSSMQPYVSGCKCACSVCAGVLEAVRLRLLTSRPGVLLTFDGKAANILRATVKMDQTTATDVAKLDIPHYFP